MLHPHDIGATRAPLLEQEGRDARECFYSRAAGWSLTDRVSVSDHPVRSFQSRTPLLYRLYQEGSFLVPLPNLSDRLTTGGLLESGSCGI